MTNQKEIISSKNEIKNELEKYEELYDKDIIEYLYSVMNLEVNALLIDEISPEIIEVLRDINAFRPLFNYNLYSYLINTLKEQLEDINSPKYKTNQNEYYIHYKRMPIVDLKLSDNKIGSHKSSINLYSITEDEKMRRKIIKYINGQLNSIVGQCNPHDKVKEKEASEMWKLQRSTQIAKLENMSEALELRMKLQENQKQKQKILKDIYRILNRKYDFDKDVISTTVDTDDNFMQPLCGKRSYQIDRKTEIDLEQQKIITKRIVKQHPLANFYNNVTHY